MHSCLLIAGEKSGEEHALSFFPELVKLCPETKFYGVGGDDLARHGMEILYHLKDFSSMGFSEVIKKIPFYFKALRHLEDEVLKRGTKTAIVVDFQDFNLRLAQKLAKHGVKVLYYVAPQAWAWKPHRAQAIARCTHTLFTILPFEKAWFNDRGVHQVKSIPHPLMKTFKDDLENIPDKPFGCWQKKLKVLLLPGSRGFEVRNLLPAFIETIKVLRRTHEVEVHLVKVGHIPADVYDYYKQEIDVFYESEDIVRAMKECHVSLAASGTVTLSTGLFELPTVVCYKSSLLNEFVVYHLIKYKGAISLTNIVHDKMVYPEFTQDRVNPHQLARVICSWIEEEKVYNELKFTLKKTKKLLSGEDFSVPVYMSQVINQ
ncbi:MAG TPA: lipid-A-disaccharide synthase [Bacteriovoracaceae bacterium]|nr:lipid-A-disaccharide synthase [Bacteriovoracaceae bacterium]